MTPQASGKPRRRMVSFATGPYRVPIAFLAELRKDGAPESFIAKLEGPETRDPETFTFRKSIDE